MKKQRLAAAGLIAGLTAGGLGGLALGAPAISFAQDTTDSTTQEPATEADHASRLLETLQPLIDDGTLTQAQADAVISALEAARPTVGPGDHRRGGPGVDAAAAAIGISTDELRQALTDGSTIAEVAQSRGVDVQTVVDAMVAELQAHLDEEVASGDHTQAEADEKIADANDRITAMVNGEAPSGPPRGGGPAS
jgi:hypothetical protein